MRIWRKSGDPAVARPVARAARGSRAGFALIEVVIASGLLAFLVFSLYTAFSFGFATIKLSQENIRADQILVQKMETLRMYDWSRVVNGYIPTNFSTTMTTSGGPGRGVSYSGAISIVPAAVAESYSNTLVHVTASVTWDSGGAKRTRSMTTLVSQNGIWNYKP